MPEPGNTRVRVEREYAELVARMPAR